MQKLTESHMAALLHSAHVVLFTCDNTWHWGLSGMFTEQRPCAHGYELDKSCILCKAMCWAVPHNTLHIQRNLEQSVFPPLQEIQANSALGQFPASTHLITSSGTLNFQSVNNLNIWGSHSLKVRQLALGQKGSRFNFPDHQENMWVRMNSTFSESMFDVPLSKAPNFWLLPGQHSMWQSIAPNVRLLLMSVCVCLLLGWVKMQRQNFPLQD